MNLIKAIGLISGGLDSTLSARLIKEQGIEIIPVHFKIPFCHRDKMVYSESKFSKIENVLGVGLKIVDISQDFLELLLNPRYGFGSNMNPCIDCKILMLRKAKDLMMQLEASFVITGEVLAQRPMSQHRQALELIERKSGLEGLLLRPLSARILMPTLPEKQGWVDRNKLLDFKGRRRRPQMDLAESLNIRDYSNPAGGCLLTDPVFSRRLKELLDYQELNLSNIELLKIGRHFRIASDTKLVVGRDEKENEELLNLAQKNDYLFMPDDELAGPTSLGRGRFNEDLVKLSCRITCRYCDLGGKIKADIIYKIVSEKENKKIRVFPVEEPQLLRLRIT